MPGKTTPPRAPQAAYTIVLARTAQTDLQEVLAWTAHAFGAIGQKRYETLIEAALLDLSADPQRAGVRARNDIGRAICTYHLHSSRKRTTSTTATQVAKPRHLLFFRVKAQQVQIIRLLHDSMDFAQHLAGAG